MNDLHDNNNNKLSFFSHVINCIIFDALAILFREGDREGREGGGGYKYLQIDLSKCTWALLITEKISTF